MQHRKTAKLGRMKPTVKRLIFHEAIRQRDVPREILANRIIKELEQSNEPPPELETAKRYISKARNAANPIDKPWSLGACRDYPTSFPPSSLPTLITMQEESKKFVDIVTDLPDPGLSIRTCMWIARLEPIIHQWMGEDNPQAKRRMLFNLANAYAFAERTSEMMGEQAFDTTDLDEAICTGDVGRVRIFAGASRDSDFVCNDDCDSCKYQPIVPGKLCQLRGLSLEEEWPEHHLIRKPPKHRNKKGE